ncbi:hypothetical protein PR048_025744 [Dryococelus australis]|uniref:Uncharacterized protein n=1 Tax=Dryococelus australis TaxID=614101 RepID=A0ABQ9GJF7_9NEOP|nr:hypothetical protein PR048_025744 [Dryococelus australis]
MSYLGFEPRTSRAAGRWRHGIVIIPCSYEGSVKPTQKSVGVVKGREYTRRVDMTTFAHDILSSNTAAVDVSSLAYSCTGRQELQADSTLACLPGEADDLVISAGSVDEWSEKQSSGAGKPCWGLIVVARASSSPAVLLTRPRLQQVVTPKTVAGRADIVCGSPFSKPQPLSHCFQYSFLQVVFGIGHSRVLRHSLPQRETASGHCANSQPGSFSLLGCYPRSSALEKYDLCQLHGSQTTRTVPILPTVQFAVAKASKIAICCSRSNCIPPGCLRNSPAPTAPYLPRPRLPSSVASWGRGGVVVRLFASHQGELGSVNGGVAPGFSYAWESCRTMTLVGVFSWVFSSPLHSGAASYSPRFILIGSNDLDVKSRPNIFTSLSHTRPVTVTHSPSHCDSLTQSLELREETARMITRHSPEARVSSVHVRLSRLPRRHTILRAVFGIPLLALTHSFAGSSGAGKGSDTDQRHANGSRGGLVVRLLSSHLDEQDWIPGGVTPRYSHVGIVSDDAAGGRLFSEISRFPALSFRRCFIHTSVWTTLQLIILVVSWKTQLNLFLRFKMCVTGSSLRRQQPLLLRARHDAEWGRHLRSILVRSSRCHCGPRRATSRVLLTPMSGKHCELHGERMSSGGLASLKMSVVLSSNTRCNLFTAYSHLLIFAWSDFENMWGTDIRINRAGTRTRVQCAGTAPPLPVADTSRKYLWFLRRNTLEVEVKQQGFRKVGSIREWSIAGSCCLGQQAAPTSLVSVCAQTLSSLRDLAKLQHSIPRPGVDGWQLDEGVITTRAQRDLQRSMKIPSNTSGVANCRLFYYIHPNFKGGSNSELTRPVACQPATCLENWRRRRFSLFWDVFYCTEGLILSSSHHLDPRWNARAGETGDPRENPPTSAIVRHDYHIRESGSDLAGNRTRIREIRTKFCFVTLPLHTLRASTSPTQRKVETEPTFVELSGLRFCRTDVTVTLLSIGCYLDFVVSGLLCRVRRGIETPA